jgi:hypothetical protein
MRVVTGVRDAYAISVNGRRGIAWCDLCWKAPIRAGISGGREGVGVRVARGAVGGLFPS